MGLIQQLSNWVMVTSVIEKLRRNGFKLLHCQIVLGDLACKSFTSVIATSKAR